MRLTLLLPLIVVIAGCQTAPRKTTWEIPLSEKNAGLGYADFAMEVADANDDEQITLVEWVEAGGSERSFKVIDTNNDGVITRTELVRLGSNAQFIDMTRRYVDFNKDNRITPAEFRSPSGIRLLRFEF